MMVSLGLSPLTQFKMLTDFGKFYEKMRVKFWLKVILWGATILAMSNCGESRQAVTFADICHENDQTKVHLRGFLHSSQATPNLTSNSALLVENENGTGGFINILFETPEMRRINSEVKIIGTVLKDNNLCVLKVEKIETPEGER